VKLTFGTATLDITDRALDREPIGTAYFDLLRAFLVDTYRTCGYYRRRFDAAKLDPATLASFDEIRRVPALWPHEVATVSELDLLDDTHAARLADGDLGSLDPRERIAKKFQSSGSQGKPKTSFYTVADWEAAQAIVLRKIAHLPRASFARIFNAFHPGHIAGKLLEDSFNRGGFHVENRHFATAPEHTMQQIYASLAQRPFTCLLLPPRAPTGTTQKGHTLADLLVDDHENFIGRHVRAIVVSGAARDLPGDDLKEAVWEVNRLADAPQTMFVDSYGTSEVAAVAAAECEHHAGVHILQGLTYTEVIDRETGRHVANGQTGLVVCTGLRRGSRYVRYVVGDEATYITDPCKCGRASPRLRDIRRVLEPEKLADGCAAGW